MTDLYTNYWPTIARYSSRGMIFAASWICVGLFGVIVASTSAIIAISVVDIVLMLSHDSIILPFLSLVGVCGMVIVWLARCLTARYQHWQFARYTRYGLDLGLLATAGFFLLGSYVNFTAMI